MSTQPPNGHHHREELMRVSQANMAVAQPAKTKSASKATNNATSKQKAQMHRRSRTGLSPFSSYALPPTARSAGLTPAPLSLPGLPSWPTNTPFVLILQLGLQLLAITIGIQWLTCFFSLFF